MAFEVISTGQFMIGIIVGIGFFAAAILAAKFLGIGSEEEARRSMVPAVLHGLIVGVLAILGTVAVGMSIGFGCANPDYYEDTVDTPEEADYGAQLPGESPATDELTAVVD